MTWTDLSDVSNSYEYQDATLYVNSEYYLEGYVLEADLWSEESDKANVWQSL